MIRVIKDGAARAALCILMVSVAAVVVPPPIATAQAPSALITIDVSQQIGRVSPRVLGVNHRYAFSGYGMWDADARAPVPSFLEQFTDSGFKVVRFPGGLVANNYHWQRAIGPVEDRGSNLAGFEGQGVTNEFGPDEFGSFIEAAGAEGTIVVNASTAGPTEAADWVEYMNTPAGPGNPRGGTDWAEVRAANGHPSPYSITYWEVGNEPWHPRQKYWMGRARNRLLAHKYAFGGVTPFHDQPVAQVSDYRPSAAFSSGTPDQVVTVRHPPVAPRDTEVMVGGSRWKRVLDIERAGGRAKVYELHNRTGRIIFGDGRSGAIPRAGAKVTVSYVSGPHAGYVGFRRMMKQVDPSIRVGSALGRKHFVRAMGSRPYDFVVMHLRGGHRIPRSDPYEVHNDVMLEPERQARRVNVLRAAIRRNTKRPARNKVAVTEWGPHRALAQAADRYLLSLDSALYSALQIKEWIEIGLPLAERHTLIDFPLEGNDLPSFGHRDEAVMGPAPEYVTSATQLVFSLYSQLSGRPVVASEVVGDPVTVTPTGHAMTALQVLATHDAGTTHVLVINRDASADVESVIDLGPHGSIPREVRGAVLDGGSFLDFNVEEHPRAVTLETTPVQWDGSELRHVFPAHSVTLITVTN